MAQPTDAPRSDGGNKTEDRFRYIGFQVFPKKVDQFWKSEAEAQQFAAKVKTGLGESVLYRESSLLEQEAMGKIDRWVLSAAGLIMVLTVALPWVGYRTSAGTDFSMYWPGALGALLGGLGTAFSAGLAVGLSALLALVVMLGAPVLGAWTLAMVWRKARTPEQYLIGLRMPLKLSYYVFFAGVLIFLFSLIGGHIPGFESWGLIEGPEKYNTAALFMVLSLGGYLAVAGALVCAVKSGDL